VATVEEIFLTALEKAPADRAGYLDAACGTDAELRAQVEALLRSHEEAGSLLEQPLFQPGPTVDLQSTVERSGTVIGPYKLLEQIGEGGMGTVWMAQQSEPVKRLVALKLIKPGMDSRQVIARFEAERQALALMDHPNIAKVFDGGTTNGEPGSISSGRPYFVMELVKGVPLTKYCDEHRLTPRRRLELFIPVCQAIQHAHQKGIIHRDIKPSNVLVALYDGNPVPKVIDFGVAKAMGTQLTEQTLVTGFGNIVGTLEYMSPEQAELNQLDVDTRSDIYSLGVLLYELLTGTTPLERKRLKDTGLLEALRLVREEETPRPSARLSTTADLPAVAASRGLEPKKLSGMIRGELDWIVMNALEKDRRRRYETASAFAADVRRYLSDEPVQACPPSAAYRLRKFARRNKGLVLGTSLVVLSLAAGAVGTTTGLFQALAAQARAVTERDQKEKARQQTRLALNTMTDEVFEDLLGRNVQLTDQHREFLKKVLAYHEAFAAAAGDDREGRRGRADGAFRVGRIRFALGEFKTAEEAYRDALALRKHLADDFPDQPEFRKDLAESHNYLGHVLSATGRPKEAEAAYRDALAVRKQMAADFPDRSEFRKLLAESLINVGVVLRNDGRPKEAEAAYRDALAVSKRLADDFRDQPEFRKEVADNYFTLGELLDATDRKAEAEAAYRDALAVRKQMAADFPKRAEAHQDLAVNQIHLGVILRSMGRRKEAEAVYREAITAAKQLAAEFPARPDFRQELALAYQNLGVLLGEMHRRKEAEAACREGLALFKQLAADFPARPDFRGMLAIALASVGNALASSGRLNEAEPFYRDALTLFKGVAAELPNHTDARREVVQLQMHLGDLLRDTKRPKEAEAAYRDGVAVSKKLAADYPDRPEIRQDLAVICNHLADLLADGGQPAEAEAVYRDALGLLKQLVVDRPDSIEYRDGLVGAHYQLGCNLGQQRRPDEAAAEYREALRIREDYPQAHTNLGNSLRDKGDVDGAITEFRAALGTKRDFPEAYKAHTNLGNALAAKGRKQEAIAEFHKAIRLNKDDLDAHYSLGNVYFPERPDEAIAEYREAIRIDKDYPEAHNNLGNSLAIKGDLDGAMAEYRIALRIKPDLFQAHLNLGRALLMKGKLPEAVAETREAARLLKDDPRVLAQLREAEQLARLDARLPAVLQGKDHAKDARESLAFARLCGEPYHQQHAAAARFFGQAFAAEPKLEADWQTGDRYNAACAAALAASGRGQDAGELDDKERAALRRQALDWLRADLTAVGRMLDQRPDDPRVVGTLKHWLEDTDFSGVRGVEALAKLPEAERQPWQKLWADVADLLARAQAKTRPQKKSAAR
jgi:serine/threonine protein kinase/tetratricopeptide (TPR) repeat protein